MLGKKLHGHVGCTSDHVFLIRYAVFDAILVAVLKMHNESTKFLVSATGAFVSRFPSSDGKNLPVKFDCFFCDFECTFVEKSIRQFPQPQALRACSTLGDSLEVVSELVLFIKIGAMDNVKVDAKLSRSDAFLEGNGLCLGLSKRPIQSSLKVV